jgi:hypothetical protein
LENNVDNKCNYDGCSNSNNSLSVDSQTTGNKAAKRSKKGMVQEIFEERGIFKEKLENGFPKQSKNTNCTIKVNMKRNSRLTETNRGADWHKKRQLAGLLFSE